MALALDETAPEDNDVTTFSPDDKLPLETGSAYCKELHDKHQFTDTSKFSLRCMVCGKGLEGEKDAIAHARETKPNQ